MANGLFTDSLFSQNQDSLRSQLPQAGGMGDVTYKGGDPQTIFQWGEGFVQRGDDYQNQLRQTLREASPQQFADADPETLLQFLGFDEDEIQEGLGYVDPYDPFDENVLRDVTGLRNQQRSRNTQRSLFDLMGSQRAAIARGGFQNLGQLDRRSNRELENISKGFRTESNMSRLGLLQGVRDLQRNYREQFLNQAGTFQRTLEG